MPKYPLAMTSDGKKAKGKMKKMKPEAFLEAARKLTVSEGDRDIINKFKDDIKAGEPMGPLKLYKDGKEDGRHRATAAKELDLDSVPVIDERTQKALGGALNSDDPNKFFSDVMKFSFAVLPLLRPGYLKEVPKQGFAEGGSVWDLLKRSASEMAEMVEPGSTTRETPSLREVATGLLPRDPYEAVGEAQKKFKEGDKLGAAEEMLGGIPETGALRFKGPARPLEAPRSVEEALEYIRGLPDVPEDTKWFRSGSFGPEVSMKELGFTTTPVLAGTKKFKPDAYVNVPLEQLRVVQPSATKELVGKYIQDIPEEIPAFSYFVEGPWKGFSQMSGTHRLAAAKALGLEKLPVGVFAKAMKPSSSPFSQTKDMPVGVSREMLQDIFGKDYLGYANGGPVVEGEVSFLEDEPSSLPTFAQPQAQEVAQALDAAREVNQPKKEYEPFGVLPLKETDQGIEFDPYAGIMGSVTRPARYFYETMTGQKPMEPTSEEAIRAATDIAGTLTMGSGAFERPAGALAAGASRPVTETPRVTNPLGMHSEAAEVARNLPQQRGTIEQLLAMMKQKVNPEELYWSGVAEAFQPGQKVTAEELASHFESRLPQVQETIYSNANENVQFTPEYLAHENVVMENFRDDLAKDKHWTKYDNLNDIEQSEIDSALREQALEMAKEGEFPIYKEGSPEYNPKEKPTMYPGYVTPGGSNYREIVLHHPENQGGLFTASHYEEPNVLGHIRMSDMEGPGGEKILNVHEFQSDWGQQARKKGVVTPDLESKLESVKNELKEAQNEYSKKQNKIVELANSGQITYRNLFEHPAYLDLEKARKEMQGLELQRQILAQQSYGVSHSPYVTSREGQHNTPGWTDLLIKRVLQEAERGGYDKVVWDTPAEQAERYMNDPQITKGMQGYYGDVLPRRHKKVAPEIKIGEHEAGKPGSTVKRPGFEMTPELKERVRRGLSAYRYGGEVEDALDVARPTSSGPDPMVLLALMKAAKMFADGGAVESPPSIVDLLREVENEEMIRKTLQAIQGTSEPSEGSATTRGGSSPMTPQETDMEALLGRVMGTTPAGELRTPGIIESVPFDSPKQKMDPGEYISRGSTAARAHPFVFEKTPYHFGEDFARGGVTDALNAVRKLAGTPA